MLPKIYLNRVDSPFIFMLGMLKDYYGDDDDDQDAKEKKRKSDVLQFKSDIQFCIKDGTYIVKIDKNRIF